MQVGGIGSGLGGHGSSHHVTNCLHDHGTAKKVPGGLKLSSGEGASAVAKTADPVGNAFSLADVLRKVVSTGKSLWGHIWGESAASGQGNIAAEQSGDIASGAEQVLAQVGAADVAERNGAQQIAQHNLHMASTAAAERNSAHMAAASTAVQVPQMSLQNNPYFTTSSHTGVFKESIFKKLRIKFRDITDQMSRRFGGRLSGSLFGRSSMKDRRKQPKQDLRKHSRYREDGLEMDCVLTDDSYLMDSYDRKGEYSKLSTRR